MKYIIAIAIVLVGGLLFMNKDKIMSFAEGNTAAVVSASTKDVTVNMSMTPGGKVRTTEVINSASVEGTEYLFSTSTSVIIKKGKRMRVQIMPEYAYRIVKIDGLPKATTAECFKTFNGCTFEFTASGNRDISITLEEKKEVTLTIIPSGLGEVEIYPVSGRVVATATTTATVKLLAYTQHTLLSKPSDGYAVSIWNTSAKNRKSDVAAGCLLQSKGGGSVGFLATPNCTITLTENATITPVFKKLK